MADTGKKQDQGGGQRGRSDQQNRPGQQGGQQRGKTEQTDTERNRNVGGSSSMDALNKDAIDTSS
jgi:hypothetical protein